MEGGLSVMTAGQVGGVAGLPRFLPLKAAAHHAVFGGENRDTETYGII